MSTVTPSFKDIDYQQVESQLKELLASQEQHLESLLQDTESKNWDNFMQPLEDKADELHLFWSKISHLHAVKDSETLRAVYTACLPLLTAHFTRLGHHQGLFAATQALRASADYDSWTAAQQKTIDNDLRDFKLAGVDLPEDKKAQMESLLQALAKNCSKFSNQVLDATQGWTCDVTDESRLAGIPEHVCVAAKSKAEADNKTGWSLTLDFPVYYAVQSYATDRDLREQMYRAYVTRASDAGPQAGKWDNGPIIDEILQGRLQLAQLLGYDNYAEYALVTKMADTAQQVLDFLQHMVQPAREKGKEEFVALQEFAEETLGIAKLQPWDVTFASEQLRQQRFAVSQEQLRPFFPVQQVLDTLSWLLKRLFGLRIERVAGVDVWHPDVEYYRLVDADGAVRSYYYMDLYARSDKRGGAWMDDLQGRRRLADGDIQLPIALINCNFTPPSADQPALLTHDEVETFFHEFGHALQHMLTTIDYPSVAGINGIPWDAVEFPSQFMENWAWEPEVLAKMARHYQTGEQLSAEVVEKMQQARHFQAAMKMLRQLEFSIFDMRLHLEYTGTESGQVERILSEVREAVGVTPVVEPNRFQNSFTHVFDGGYAAGYYSYKWAEVMAVDAFGLFRERGLFDGGMAQEFLRCVLEPGGSRDPADLFRELAGRDPDPQALLRHDRILMDA